MQNARLDMYQVSNPNYQTCVPLTKKASLIRIPGVGVFHHGLGTQRYSKDT